MHIMQSSQTVFLQLEQQSSQIKRCKVKGTV